MYQSPFSAGKSYNEYSVCCFNTAWQTKKQCLKTASVQSAGPWGLIQNFNEDAARNINNNYTIDSGQGPTRVTD